MPTMSNAYLGIDVAKAKLDVCLLRDKGLAQCSKPKNCLLPNSPEGFEALIQWLNVQKVTDFHVCMEATAHYSNGVARFLVEKGYTVSVVNPAAIRAFAHCELARGKSDKADAGRIARYCSLHRPLKPSSMRWKPRLPVFESNSKRSSNRQTPYAKNANCY